MVALRRWSADDEKKLAEMRKILGDKLTTCKQYPELVGDRRLLRFLYGQSGDVAKAAAEFEQFLKWREENGIDAIRDEILKGGMNNPDKFPNAAKSLEAIPMIAINPHSTDKLGNPLVLEEIKNSPDDVMAKVTKEEYQLFYKYVMEYRVLVLEQLAHNKEVALKASLEEKLASGALKADAQYGVQLRQFIIHDFTAFGMNYTGSNGQAVMGWSLEINGKNYPDMIARAHLINTPWYFSTAFYFISPFLDAATAAQVRPTSYGCMDVVPAEMDVANIPKKLGGQFEEGHIDFEFDLSETGPFYCP